jgi:predicted metal-binding membrane protein
VGAQRQVEQALPLRLERAELSASPARLALRRERLTAACVLLLVVAACWAWLVGGAGLVDGDALRPLQAHRWSAGEALAVFVMWAVMMAAMMLPSAAPMILLFDSRADESFAATGGFVLGYLAVWTAFSLAATALQLALEHAALLSSAMRTTSLALGAGVLAAAGLYQFSSAKRACLEHCRSPLGFLMAHWRAGASGAFAMGWRHGLYCLGCCWMLMLLLFVGGVMNLAWIAGIAAFVLVEKTVPAGHWVARAAGALLVLWGLATLALAVT